MLRRAGPPYAYGCRSPRSDVAKSILPSGVPLKPGGIPALLVGGSGPLFMTTSGCLMPR